MNMDLFRSIPTRRAPPPPGGTKTPQPAGKSMSQMLTSDLFSGGGHSQPDNSSAGGKLPKPLAPQPAVDPRPDYVKAIMANPAVRQAAYTTTKKALESKTTRDIVVSYAKESIRTSSSSPDFLKTYGGTELNIESTPKHYPITIIKPPPQKKNSSVLKQSSFRRTGKMSNDLIDFNAKSPVMSRSDDGWPDTSTTTSQKPQMKPTAPRPVSQGSSVPQRKLSAPASRPKEPPPPRPAHPPPGLSRKPDIVRLTNRGSVSSCQQPDILSQSIITEAAYKVQPLTPDTTLDLPHGRALFDFNAQSADDLSFKTGDVVMLISKVNDEWLLGHIGSRQGMCPANFINVIVPITTDITETSLPSGGPWAAGPWAVCNFQFKAGSSDELPINIGDSINLTERINDDWLRGELAGKSGIFPAAFVNIIEDFPVKSSVSSSTSHQKSTEISTATTDDRAGQVVIAIFDYESATPGDLNFKAGEKIIIDKTVSADWLEGWIGTRHGIFPDTFVERKRRISESKSSDQYGVALYDFSGQPSGGELSFSVGDQISIMYDIDQHWSYGRIGKTEGIFPKSFVSTGS